LVEIKEEDLKEEDLGRRPGQVKLFISALSSFVQKR
jgi:hypothetical protein